jgi:hypothetical protein
MIQPRLETVQSRIETFEDAFLAHIVLEDGRTVGEIAIPGIAAIYQGSNVPLLPPPERMQ